ncbi:hypothetical protein ES703_126018 [subsurface metagenome]
MREVNLDGIEEKYNQVKAFMGTLGKISREFNEDQGITEDYSGPFNQRYDLERLVAEIRKNLIHFLVGQLNTELCPNVTISASDIDKLMSEKFGELSFSAHFIHRHIQANFATRSDALSREEILTKARHLVPSRWDNHGRRKSTLEELVKGRKLTLQAYMDSYYPNSRDGLTALEKLAKIILDDEDPTTVSADEISTIYWHKTGDDYYRTYDLQDKNIEKVRAHKNNKFLVYFRDEEKARQVAQALLLGFSIAE